MKLIKKTSLFFGLMLSYSITAFSLPELTTKEYTLPNKLKVLVKEDHRTCVAVAQIWYKVGSADEARTGISHVLEHMMFQGTSQLPGDGFVKRMNEQGGRSNAFTSEDFTAYYVEADASKLPIIFAAEADRMINLAFSEQAFVKEMQVVIEERRLRTDDNPQSITWERFMAAANVAGPYHHPVVGWRSDLERLSLDEVRAWYHQWYAPNNATLVVVGDVDAEAVFKLAEEHFGALHERIVPTYTRPELPSLGERRIKVEAGAKLPYVIWGYDVPHLSDENDDEPYALMAISALLDGGESARLVQQLVRGQMATQINTYYLPFKRFDSQFVITAVPASSYSVEQLEAKLMEQIQRLQTQAVEPEELQKIKTQILAQHVFSKDAMSEQANLLGLLASVGLPWQIAERFPEKINALTAQQIQQVAQKYFHPQRLTVAQLVAEQ